MNPQELRIGNWVEYEGRYFQIHCLSPELPSLNTIEFGIGVIGWNDLIPIPLTEDVLVKCGISISLWSLYISGFPLRVYVKEDGYYVVFEYDDFDGGMESGKRIEYLHQLQNLIFVLTGTELTANI